MTTTQALPTDDCMLDGPCGFCATLTPSDRAALAETLATDASPSRPVEPQERLSEQMLFWNDALSEQTSQLESATVVLTDASAGAWREACRDFLAIEIAKTVGLVVAAPAGALIIRAGTALTAARSALAGVLPQS